MIDYFLDVFHRQSQQTFLVANGHEYTYGALLQLIEKAEDDLNKAGVTPHSVVAILGDFTIHSLAMFFALTKRASILVPISPVVKTPEEFFKTAQVEYVITTSPLSIQRSGFEEVQHPILLSLKERKRAGLVLFSSATTGKHKAIVHDFSQLLESFQRVRPVLKTMAFLLFDHIGGINTMLHVASQGGMLITTTDRSPEHVSSLIEKYQVELLPTSPTFLNMLLMSKCYEHYNLRSLKMISYGTEVMPQKTLDELQRLFPDLQLKQTYGLSEVGIMRSQSKGNNTLWFKIGGPGYETKVENQTLHIKSKYMMLGYLNAPNPIDSEGWFDTHDTVEVEGDWVRILGRDSDLINVGGQKVYPAEVESVLLGMPGVKEVSVFKSPNRLLGFVVGAHIVLEEDTKEDLLSFKNRLRAYCANLLESYKIPVQVSVSTKEEELYTERFKKRRSSLSHPQA